jgi:AcrR family transcriptional regulator
VDLKKRRRGAELEAALLEAAWDELVERGYADFTLDGVADRARTSRPVLARRWPSRSDLVLAAIRHEWERAPRMQPDTGSLREDVLATLRFGNENRLAFAAVVGIQLAGYFAETGQTFADLRQMMIGDGTHSAGVAVQRAVDRGEVDPARVTPRIVNLPYDLLRHEFLMTRRPVPDETLIEIVDQLFLPLLGVTPPSSAS